MYGCMHVDCCWFLTSLEPIRLCWTVLSVRLSDESAVNNESTFLLALTDVKVGTMNVSDVDIHSVTGVLKLYFRELPEPLFTEDSYTNFVDALSEYSSFLL